MQKFSTEAIYRSRYARQLLFRTWLLLRTETEVEDAYCTYRRLSLHATYWPRHRKQFRHVYLESSHFYSGPLPGRLAHGEANGSVCLGFVAEPAEWDVAAGRYRMRYRSWDDPEGPLREISWLPSDRSEIWTSWRVVEDGTPEDMTESEASHPGTADLELGTLADYRYYTPTTELLALYQDSSLGLAAERRMQTLLEELFGIVPEGQSTPAAAAAAAPQPTLRKRLIV